MVQNEGICWLTTVVHTNQSDIAVRVQRRKDWRKLKFAV